MDNLVKLARRLPEPYEDELWYSVLSRYHRMSGNLTENETFREIMPGMLKGRDGSIPILTINNYSIWAMKGDERALWDIYSRHTLEPYWFRFSKQNSKINAYVKSITRYRNKKIDNPLTTFHLDKMRYCPLCAEEERKLYGETFWHRLPQIPLLVICPKHKCRLVESNIKNIRTTRLFITSDAAVLAQQLQDEEDKTGLKRLISNNLTEYEQPFYDFVTGLQNGDAVGTAKALGVPNTFGDKIQNWIVVNNYETFQKAELKHICFNSAKDGSTAVINVYMGTPSEVTADTTPDYVMNVDYVDGAWALTPPTGVVKDYTFSTPTNKVSFEGTDLSQYAAKSASTGEWSITLPRALDFENDSTYVITNDMGDYNGHVYDVTSDGTVSHMLLADLDTDTKETYQAKLEAVLKEAYRLLSIGASENDFSNVLLDSAEIAKCVPTALENEDDVTTAAENARKKAIGASVTNVTVTADDTLEGYPDAYTYRLSGNDGVIMDVKLKVTTTNGDARMKAAITLRLINGAWKVVSIDSAKDIFTGLSVLDPEW